MSGLQLRVRGQFFAQNDQANMASRVFTQPRSEAGVGAVERRRSHERLPPQDTLKASASGQKGSLTSYSASFPAWPLSFLSSFWPAFSFRLSSNPYPCSYHFLGHSHGLSSRAVDISSPSYRGLHLRGIS